MPPALRNQRAPTAGDTPAPTAASSVEHPAAIAAQNSWRSSRRATEGRPGDGNAPRPDRSERRFRTVIATSSHKVLRRPLEPGGDRFYGSPALIAWCRAKGWAWRLRLKHNLLVFEQGGESTLGECFARGEPLLRDVRVTEQRVRTHVAMVHEAGHPEPWIIALSDPPTAWRAYDYGLRWGIEGAPQAQDRTVRDELTDRAQAA